MRESFRRRPREEPASRGHADLATTGGRVCVCLQSDTNRRHTLKCSARYATRMIAIRDGVGICPVYRPDAART